MGLHPKPSSNLQCIDPELFPPRNFIAGLMKLSMVTAAERHGELIADLKTNGSRLREAQMMRVARLSAAD